MGLFNSRSAAALSWLLMSLALLHVQAQPSRYIPRGHHIRRISHPNYKMQTASQSLLHPISVPLLTGALLKLPPPPNKFAYATFAPIPATEDPNDPVNGFIQLVLANQPLYPPAPYQKQTEPTTTAVPTTEAPTTVSPPTTVAPTTAKLYVRPPPTTAKSFVKLRPITVLKTVRPKTVKPTKKPLNTIPKFTKATPAPTSSAAPIDDVRLVGGEMMKLDANKAIGPVSSTVAAISAVTAPASISTAAPNTVPPISTTPAPISTKSPETVSVPIQTEGPKEVLKAITPIPLSFSSFQPYPKPFYRPAIYTRPPFRPHRGYTLLPKSTEAPASSEVLKLNVDESLSEPTSTEAEPEIVTVKEKLPGPAPFDDFEMFKELAEGSKENAISIVDVETKLSEFPELPPLITEEPANIEDPEELIIVEDDLKSIDILGTIPEEDHQELFIVEDDLKSIDVVETIPEEDTTEELFNVETIQEENPEDISIFEDDSNAIDIIETIPEEDNRDFVIFEENPKADEVIEAIQEDPKLFEFIGNEPEDFVFISDEPEILEFIPNEPNIIESIPAELSVDDVVHIEPENIVNIPELPTINKDILEPERVEPQIVEAEKLLPVDYEESIFDYNLPETSNDESLSTEETELADVPDIDFEMGRVSEDVTEAVPVAVEVPKIIKVESKPDLTAPENQDALEVSDPIPTLEKEFVVESLEVFLPEVQEVVTTVEPQPFKRSQKYEPVWNIHTFGNDGKNNPPRSQSFPGWPELSSTTRRSHDYPIWLESSTSSPFARNIPDLPKDVTTHRGYIYSKWSPKLENDKKSTADTWRSEKPFSPEIKTIETNIRKFSEGKRQLTQSKNGKKRGRRIRTSTVKPTTRMGNLPTTTTSTKSTTVKAPDSTLFPTWEEIQTRKASRERTSSESKDSQSGFGTGFGTGFGFGDWGGKI